MFTRYVLPILAVLGFVFAIYTVRESRKSPSPSQPIETPPLRPRTPNTISGAGLIEARMENIPIGTPVAGVVWEVYVKVGDIVKKGMPLFRLDDREVRSELKIRQAALQSAEAQLHRLENAPRPEDLPPAEAAVEEAAARLADAEAAFNRDERLFQRQMIAASDFDKDRYAVQAAKATLAKARADLARLRAGSWKEDIAIARASCEQARSQLESSRVMLDRLTVCALADGEVLQVNVRVGQFAALAWREPMIVLGDVNRLHVRVDIDENDLPRFRPSAKAEAHLKGRPEPKFPLDFVKVEPYVIPKRSLTGDNSERVDTRVLQVIYALPDHRDLKLYVGQQMDVFLDLDDSNTSVPESASGSQIKSRAGGR
jgi:multidrug resistance efflux pump